MTFTHWNTAHGEAAPAWLSVAATVPLSPADDSVDTNTVFIEGAGTITSFGDCQHHVLKRVKFVPLVMVGREDMAASATIILENSARLNLLSGQQRSISKVSYGMYACDGNNKWNEVYFVQQGAALINELEERLQVLEEKINRIMQT
jgi:hypothetical protein